MTGANVILESYASLTAGIKGSLPSITRGQTQGPPHPVARQLGIPDPKPGTAVKGLHTGRCPGNSVIAITEKITDRRLQIAPETV